MTEPLGPPASRLIAGGALGSSLVAVGGFGAGAVPAVLRDTWLHASTAGRGLSYGCCALGTLLLLACWWRLQAATPRSMLAAAAAWCAPLLLAPPLFSRDVYAYAAQAHLVAVGLNPYTHGPLASPGPLSAEVDDVWARARSPYGPLFLRLASWLVPGQHVILAVLVLRLLEVAGLALLAWAIMRLARDVSRALWLAVTNPLVLLHGIGGAHNDVLMAGVLMAGLALALPTPVRTGAPPTGHAGRAEARSAPPLLGVALGAVGVVAAALVKLPAGAAVAFLLVGVGGRRRSAAPMLAVAAAASALLLTAACGLGWGWVHTLGAGGGPRSLLSLSTGLGEAAGAVGGGAAALTFAHAAGLLCAAGVALTLLVLAWRRRIDVLAALGWTLLAVAVLGPVVQPWYLFWALPVLAAIAGDRLTRALAAASAVLCLLILPGGRHLIRPPLYGVPTAVLIAAGYATSRRSPRSAPIEATT